MRLSLLLLCALLPLCPAAAQAETPVPPVVVVESAYIDVHSGPASDFPIFHVVARGERMEVLMQRTAWIKVRAARGIEGWVSVAQMQQTHLAEGGHLDLHEPGEEDYAARTWEMGLTMGDLDGARVITLYGGRSFTPTLSGELSLSDAMGDYSRSWSIQADLLMQPFADWRASPFFAVGAGMIHTEPRTTLVQSRNRDDAMAHAGLGVRLHLSRQFLFRAEYRGHVVFTAHDKNEELDEWKAGFAFFF